ncbi:MAG TPA: MBL fold metallo-hydrolase [Gemmatimonadaceae bacterium]|nr:MBL fold metallo-hydrolase [Gemmatimonadaceae bacterium]
MRITYIGHATVLIEVAGHRILTDPNFDVALGRFLPRVSAPGIALDALPKLDAILLSHAHADHLSFTSLAALPSDIPLFAPPKIAQWLATRGWKNATPLPWGGSVAVGDITIHAAVARHMGSRYGYDRWRGDASMYLLDTGTVSLFFAGDTGLTEATHRLVEDRLRPHGRQLDVALLPIGHAPWWKFNFRRGHLTTADAITLFERLDAKIFIPYHWGTFDHVTAKAHDAIVRLRAHLPTYARQHQVRIIEPGEAFELTAAAGVA